MTSESVKSLKQILNSPARQRALILGYTKLAREFGHTVDELSTLLEIRPDILEGLMEDMVAEGYLRKTNKHRSLNGQPSRHVYVVL